MRDLWTIVNLYGTRGTGGPGAAADITVIFVMLVCGAAWQFRHAREAAEGVFAYPFQTVRRAGLGKCAEPDSENT